MHNSLPDSAFPNAPIILSALLMSMELCEHFRVFPDSTHQADLESKTCKLSTPEDASCTHILVLPISATAQAHSAMHQDSIGLGLDAAAPIMAGADLSLVTAIDNTALEPNLFGLDLGNIGDMDFSSFDFSALLDGNAVSASGLGSANSLQNEPPLSASIFGNLPSAIGNQQFTFNATGGGGSIFDLLPNIPQLPATTPKTQLPPGGLGGLFAFGGGGGGGPGAGVSLISPSSQFPQPQQQHTAGAHQLARATSVASLARPDAPSSGRASHTATATATDSPVADAQEIDAPNLMQQPLSIGFYVSTAPLGPVPPGLFPDRMRRGAFAAAELAANGSFRAPICIRVS